MIARIGPRIGFANYRTKISEIVYVENDPELKCEHYSRLNKYSDCLEEKLIQSIHSFLPCIPPWLTDDKDKWCIPSIFLEKNESKALNFILTNIIDGHDSGISCQTPCHFMHFNTKLTLFDERDTKYGLFVQFEDTVDVRRSNIVISPTTLVTRIGGIIGVGKELFWIILLVFSGSLMFTLDTCKLFCSSCTKPRTAGPSPPNMYSEQ